MPSLHSACLTVGGIAARVEQNGAIYNQSQKSHSSSSPGVTSSGSLYCRRTRQTLNQLLFDDFLSAATAIGVFARPLHSAASTPCFPTFSSVSIESSDSCTQTPLRNCAIASCQNSSEWTTGRALLSTVESTEMNSCLPLK